MERFERDFLLLHSNVLTQDGGIGEDLQRRLDFVAEGFRNNRFNVKVVIAAGKCGRRDKNYVDTSGRTQADAIEQFLREQGVGAEIWKENLGTTTFDCTTNAYRGLILPKGYQSGIVISTAEHLARIMFQTYQVFHPELYGNCVFMGPPIKNDAKRGEFLRREVDSFAKYTQPELLKLADRLCPPGQSIDPY